MGLYVGGREERHWETQVSAVIRSGEGAGFLGGEAGVLLGLGVSSSAMERNSRAISSMVAMGWVAVIAGAGFSSTSAGSS